MISPMEQFELYTVSFFTSAIFFMIVASLLCLRALTLTSFSISGNWWAILNESLYHTLLAMTRDYIGPKYTALFPFIFLPLKHQLLYPRNLKCKGCILSSSLRGGGSIPSRLGFDGRNRTHIDGFGDHCYTISLHLHTATI
jgi:hypothetical protein